MRPGRPASLLIVACLFVTFGLHALVLTIIGLYRGTGGVNLAALDLLVGFGLLRRDPYWRRWALVACGIGVLGSGILLSSLLFGFPSRLTATFYGRPLNQMSRTYAFAFVLAGLAIMVWQLWVLTRPSVRAYFNPPAQRAQSSTPAPSCTLQ
jgi:hypothetical protein